MLKGDSVLLRDLELSDLDFLLHIENNKENWLFGSEERYFSKEELVSYINNSSSSLVKDKQYRFVIECYNKSIGFIDLFNYNLNTAEVGVIIDTSYRKKGYASEALNLLINYSFNIIRLDSLKCSVSIDNKISIRLFEKYGFKLTYSENKINYYILENNL